MHRIGPTFLHKPLPAFDQRAIEDAMTWLIEGLRFWLPTNFRARGWRATERVYRCEADATLSGAGIVERSWAGDRRLADAAGSDANLPASVVLDDALIFRTKLNLPREAAGNVRRAVELRLDEVSPLPPREVEFAIGAVKHTPKGRINVDVALARKADLTRICADRELETVSKITAQAGADKSFTFYDRSTGERFADGKLGIAGLALMLSIVAFGFSFQYRGDAHIAALGEYEAHLRQNIARIRVENESLEHALSTASPSTVGSDVSASIMAALKALPEQVVVEEITFENSVLSIAVLAPVDTAWPQSLKVIQVVDSDYPGFVAAKLSLAAQEARLES